MNLNEQIRRIRRFLRDPSGKIWSRELIIDTFNEIAEDLQRKMGILEAAIVLRVPGYYQWSYLFNWERIFLPFDDRKHYKALYQDSTGSVHSTIWEAQQADDEEGITTDPGCHFTQPWEGWYGPQQPGAPIRS